MIGKTLIFIGIFTMIAISSILPNVRAVGICPFEISSLLTFSCLDNSTEIGTIMYNNQTHQTQRTCIYGCDAISGCKPAPFYTDLATMGIFFGAIVVFAFIVWVVRKI
jgi:hypothetical protein